MNIRAEEIIANECPKQNSESATRHWAKRFERILEHAQKNPSRRLSNDPEIVIDHQKLCQTIHMSAAESKSRLLLGGVNSGYYLRTLDSAKAEIAELLELGINSVYLQYQAGSPSESPRHRLNNFCRLLNSVREEFKDAINITADPQGICMGSDLRWGVRGTDGTVDPTATLRLLEIVGVGFAQAGIDCMMTIGRVNYESEVARSSLDKVNPKVKLWSFSTNSETPNAYFDVTRHNISKAETRQKILIGNIDEMLLRSLHDISEGVDVVVQKPIDNLQVILALRNLMDGTLKLNEFLERPRVRQLLETNPHLLEGGYLTLEHIAERLDRTKIGAYEVSGTYAIFKHIEDEYSPDLAMLMLEELYSNCMYAGENRLDKLIGRNMHWFAKQRKALGRL